MIDIINKLFGSKNGSKPEQPEEVFEYKGFDILPTPSKIGSGWSTAATISKTSDGETRTHYFIRADTTSTRDAAVELTINKAKMCIDQIGDQMFNS
jgi:hypothetical protein